MLWKKAFQKCRLARPTSLKKWLEILPSNHRMQPPERPTITQGWSSRTPSACIHHSRQCLSMDQAALWVNQPLGSTHPQSKIQNSILAVRCKRITLVARIISRHRQVLTWLCSRRLKDWVWRRQDQVSWRLTDQLRIRPHTVHPEQASRDNRLLTVFRMPTEDG